MRRGRLQREQDTLDREYVSHEELLASGQCSAGAANEPLNRYCNLFPLDAHRVVLQGKPQGGASSDFVNASHVVLPSLPPDEAARGPFIVAQGPMHPDWHGPDTLPAFWRMVSEQDVGTVVSMSRTGRGFTGFAPWWPQGGAGSEATYGEFRVRCASEETTVHANVIRELWFSSTQGDSSDERRVVQLQTTAWPNYGVPEETGGVCELLHLCRATREEHAFASTSGRCTLVHCSGGVGRSGTFLTAFTAMASTLWAGAPWPGAQFSLLPTVRALRP